MSCNDIDLSIWFEAEYMGYKPFQATPYHGSMEAGAQRTVSWNFNFTTALVDVAVQSHDDKTALYGDIGAKCR